MINTTNIFDYEDVQLIPNKCIVSSRSECDTTVKLGNRTFRLPIVPANMQTIIDEKLAKELAAKNYFYIMHRFQPEKRLAFVKDMHAAGLFASISIGVLVDENVDPNEVLHHVEGMMHLYHELGDFKNRGKARSRFIAQRLGEEEFRKAYHEFLEKSKAAHDLTLSVEPYTVNKVGTTTPTTALAEPQKQTGLYYIQYKPLVGTPPIDVFVKLFDYVGGLEETEIRICGDESVYIVNLTGEEADAVAAIIADTHAKNKFEQTVSCVGATICQIGFQDSSGLVKVIKETLEAEGLSTDRLPQLHVSGCPSSCGTHQVGSLGFHGFTKVVDKQPQPAFKVFVNGNGEVEGQRMSDELGVITVTDIPKFFIDLVKALEEANQDFDTWKDQQPEAFQAVLSKYL